MQGKNRVVASRWQFKINAKKRKRFSATGEVILSELVLSRHPVISGDDSIHRGCPLIEYNLVPRVSPLGAGRGETLGTLIHSENGIFMAEVT